jgi:hypothetical protein
MKAVNTRKMISLSVLTGLIALSVGTAAAQSPQHAGPKVVSKTHQPVGTPHKASSFAPRPTTRRVFGAPIQPQILHSAPKKPDPK